VVTDFLTTLCDRWPTKSAVESGFLLNFKYRPMYSACGKHLTRHYEKKNSLLLLRFSSFGCNVSSLIWDQVEIGGL